MTGHPSFASWIAVGERARLAVLAVVEGDSSLVFDLGRIVRINALDGIIFGDIRISRPAALRAFASTELSAAPAE